MPHRASSLAPLVVLSLLGACGGRMVRVEGDDGGSGGAAQAGGISTGAVNGNGATSSGAAAQGGTAQGGGSASGGKSNGGAGAPTHCDAGGFPDALGGSILVRLINKTAKPIYLGPQQAGCGVEPLFEVADIGGRKLTPPGFCELTCQQQISRMVPGCPPVACAVSSVIMLQPGESRQQLWNGLYLDSVALSPPCAAVVGAGQCTLIRAVQPGPYLFSAVAGRSTQCLVPQGGCSECQPDPNGGCVISNAVMPSPMLYGTAEVKLDASYGLGPGDDGVGMMRSAVDVVFQE